MRVFIYRLVMLFAVFGVISPFPAAAQSGYPSEPIRFFVGFPAGGGTDIMARAIAQKLSLALHGSVVVENYPGANGNIASDMVAHAKPDGYTIMMIALSHAVNASLYRHLGYDPVKNFIPVIGVSTVPMVLTVPKSSPIGSVKELIALAKQKPGKITFSSGGIGSPEHISGELFQQLAGIELVHVPYKGSGMSLSDLLGGRIDMAFNTMPSVLPYIKAGNLRPLAVGDRHRSAVLPNVPTMIEAGVSGYDLASWYGVLAPAGTPPDIVLRLNIEINKILKEPDIIALFAKLGAQPTGGTPAQFGTFLTAEMATMAGLVKEYNLYVN